MFKKILSACAGLVLSSGISLAIDVNSKGAAAPANAPFAAPAAAAVPEMQLQIRQGRSIQCAVPDGWSFSDTNNGVDSMAPDGITWMSHTTVRGPGRCNPDLWLQRSSQGWARLGISDVQVVSAQVVAPQSKLYEMDYTFRGRPAHAIVQVTVQQNQFGFIATTISLQSARESFQQALPVLVQMSRSVRITNAGEFADKDKINGQINKRIGIATETSREIGNTYIQGEKARGAVRDLDHKAASDPLRSVTRFIDAGGNEYTGPLQAVRAFKHADGTISYTSSVSAPVPSDATELKPFDYSGKN